MAQRPFFGATLRSGDLRRAPALFAAFLAALALAGCAGRAGACGPAAPCAEDCAAVAPPCSPCGALPPEAKPGEAWCCVWVPPVTKEVAVTCCVKPACTKKVPVPAVYGTRPVLVCVAPARITEKQMPAVWTTRKRDVLVCPERECVEPVCCPPTGLGPCEEQCVCYRKKVLPPVWCEQEEAVCLEPSRCRIEYQPAQYKVVEERFVLKPAHCETVCVAAEHATRFETVVCTPGRWEWRLNPDCVVPELLPAIEVTMVDSDPSGSEAGIFRLGGQVRYDLTVSNDVGGKALESLKVVFTLPAELEFVSGGGDAQFVGGGQQAESRSFHLSLDQKRTVHIVAKVVALPQKGANIQTVASIVTAEGLELVRESESTTLALPADRAN
jgi:hypothetical protein